VLLVHPIILLLPLLILSQTHISNVVVELDIRFEVELEGEFCGRIQPCDMSN